MQRWKTLAPVEEPAAPLRPPCAWGAVPAGEWAYCAVCGRPVAGGLRGLRAAVTPLTVAAIVLAFAVGLLVGGRGNRGTDEPARLRAEREAEQLRVTLANAERTAGPLQERNRSLRKQVMDRHDAVARQLARRNDALRRQLKERNEAVRKQLAARDLSIDVLAERNETIEQEAAEETAALRATLEEAEAQLKDWLDSQQAANRLLPNSRQGDPPAAREPGGADPNEVAGDAPGEQPTAAEETDAFWARFNAEYPDVNGRALWEESLRAAAEEIGPDHPDFRARAEGIFEANLQRAQPGNSPTSAE